MKRSVVLIALVAAGCISLLGYLTIVFPDRRCNGKGDVVSIYMPDGATVDHVVQQLSDARILDDPTLLRLYIRVIGADKRFRSGQVRIVDNMSIREVIQRLAKGFGYAQVTVTIPEGVTRFDIARIFERWSLCCSEDFLQATEDSNLLNRLEIAASSAEGYLFPDTYKLHDGLEPAALIRRLHQNFLKRTQNLLEEYSDGLDRLKRDYQWNFHQVLILASVVEKEAALFSEQRLISGVFLNRLHRKEFPLRRLQADPTVSYGCLVAPTAAPSCAFFDGKRLTRSMTQDAKNSYNTYRHQGLPPGPISNPGLQAIRAVLDPAIHDYFYFVVSEKGRHRFSKTVEEHNIAVQAYRNKQTD